MGKWKAKRAPKREVESEYNTSEVDCAATTNTYSTLSIRAEPLAEGATREPPATSVAVPASHVDCAGAELFWTLLENAGYIVW